MAWMKNHLTAIDLLNNLVVINICMNRKLLLFVVTQIKRIDKRLLNFARQVFGWQYGSDWREVFLRRYPA